MRMKRCVNNIVKKFKSSQKGATAIEYGLIASLIVIGMLSGLQAFSGSSTNGFNGAMNKLSTAISAR